MSVKANGQALSAEQYNRQPTSLTISGAALPEGEFKLEVRRGSACWGGGLFSDAWPACRVRWGAAVRGAAEADVVRCGGRGTLGSAVQDTARVSALGCSTPLSADHLSLWLCCVGEEGAVQALGGLAAGSQQ